MQVDPRTGWPMLGEDPPPMPTAESEPAKASAPAAGNGLGQLTGAAREAASRPIVSGLKLGSPLHDVYRAVRSPGAFQQLGGVVVRWRLTIHGSNGEAIGVREVTHTADSAFADHDRLDHTDGRVYGRLGEQTFAQRSGYPWPTLVDAAKDELMLFGVQLRVPWCLADDRAFVVLAHDVQARQGERLTHILLERRPPPALEVFGPEQDPKPKDRIELFCQPSTGQPIELVHRFASSMQTRRVLLEDWRDLDGVRMPYRRIYVDESLRPTTTLQILNVERRRVSERDFRLH